MLSLGLCCTDMLVQNCVEALHLAICLGPVVGNSLQRRIVVCLLTLMKLCHISIFHALIGRALIGVEAKRCLNLMESL